MLKAILLVTVLGVSGDYMAEMPSMNECLDARTTIAEQDPTVKTLCVPMTDNTLKVQEFFEAFMNIIDQIREEESERSVLKMTPSEKGVKTQNDPLRAP